MNIRILSCGLSLLIAAGLVSTGCGGGGGKEVAGLPSATVTSTSPANGASQVATSNLSSGTNTVISATFSKTMEASTFTTSSFYATSASGPLPGVVTYAGQTANLQLNSPMPQNALITVTITTAVRDNGTAGQPGHAALPRNYVWTFTTGTNDPPPTVASTNPSASATGVSPSTSVSVTFNKPMNAASINNGTFTLSGPAGPKAPKLTKLLAIGSTVTYSNGVATLAPTSSLAANSVYTATVTTGVTDVAGSPMAANYVWTFTTAAADIAPLVKSTIPAQGATGVSISSKLSATFSEAMNAATVTGTTFSVSPAGGSPISATVTYANGVAVLDPTAALIGNTVYTATLTTAITDVAGTPLASNYQWTFTTSATDIAPVVLTTTPAPNALGVSISSNLTVTFSESMHTSTINSTNITLVAQGGSSVPLTVSYANDVAVINPTSALASGTTYTATVSGLVQDVANTPMGANYSWKFTTGTTDVAPTIISTNPANLAAGVALNTNVMATFSEAMNASTITGSNFTLVANGGANITGTVTYANSAATFTPSAPLLAGVTYTATISTGVQDVAGTALASAYSWKFTEADVPPTVISTIPLALATGVPNNTTVSATFSKAMLASSITPATMNLTAPNNVPVPATVSYANSVATLTPISQLIPGTLYTATVTTAVQDVAGTPLANTKTWTFTTDTAPAITTTSPLNLATQVGTGDSVTASFSKNMLASTINGTTFLLTGPGNLSVPGTVSYANDVATFAPTSALAGTTTYTATVTTGVKDLAGTSLANAYTWSFTTGQAGVNLGVAGTYAVLAGSTVTNAGPTILNGNLGVSPGTAITGFPPGTFSGVENAGNSAAAQAKTALLAAEIDAAGRLNAQALPGDLSGLTITPGLYKNSTSVMISSGNLTFDAKGDSGAIFILQMGSTLTTGVGTGVILAGGAQPGNIYWSVGSSATLGVNSSFSGVILASASITANTGATINGLLLTQVAAVTLQSNTVTAPPSYRKKGPPAARKRI